MLRSLALALLAALLATPPALGDATLQGYHTLPTEHDDQGRVDEPDFATTGVLGVALENCVLSLDPFAVPGLGRACRPDSALPPFSGVIAPGCTDDSGRQPSGLCALWSNGLVVPTGSGPVPLVAPGTAGVSGMSGDAAPGAFTPTKGRAVRFFDLQVAASVPGSTMVETNRKLADAGAAALLQSLAPGDLPIPTAASVWAWYGVWQDKNGNGVVDHLGDGSGHAWPTNEFQWVGGCGALDPGVCLREPGLVMPLWVYPGNHHGECGFLFGCYLPADMPGRQAVCFASFDVVGDPSVFRCFPAGDFDAEDRDADPLLGPGDARVSADGELRDGTLDANATKPELRRWFYGLVPAYFYDQSLLTTTVMVGGPTLRGRDDGLAQRYDLAALQFVDVDRHDALAPLAGEALHQTLRPQARGPWVLARDLYPLLGGVADGAVNQRGLDAPTQPLAASDAALRDPGWSREPNHPLDRLPGAAFRVFAPGGALAPGEQDHRGWRNDYAAAQAWHGWADVHAERVQFTYGPFAAGPLCVPPCAIGGGFWDAWSVLPGPGAGIPRAGGDHGRSLDPGAYQFRGFAGAWRDAPRTVVERTVDLPATLQQGEVVTREEAYVLPPDGWVGDIVATTGASRARGYDDATCFLEGREQVRAWAVCNPYLDTDVARVDGEAGAAQSFGLGLGDPQDYADGEEFQVLTTPPAATVVVLRPASGVWTFPVFVWRDFYHWSAGDAGAFEDFTGSAQPVVLRVLPQLSAALRSRVVTEDLVLLPAGNLGEDVTTTFAMQVQVEVPSRGIAVDEAVVDVDAYRAWGLP